MAKTPRKPTSGWAKKKNLSSRTPPDLSLLMHSTERYRAASPKPASETNVREEHERVLVFLFCLPRGPPAPHCRHVTAKVLSCGRAHAGPTASSGIGSRSQHPKPWSTTVSLRPRDPGLAHSIEAGTSTASWPSISVVWATRHHDVAAKVMLACGLRYSPVSDFTIESRNIA